MSQWTGEQRAFAIEAYFKANDSCAISRRRFCSRYNIRRLRDAPSEDLIRSWVRRFRATSSAENNPRPGPSRTSRTNENIELVASSLSDNPRQSVRKRAAALGLPKTIVHEILKKDLKLSCEKQNRMSPIKPNPAKMLLRTEVASRIAALSPNEKKRQSQIVFDKVINHPWYKASKRIALFMSTADEVDTSHIIQHINSRGAAAFVPQYAGGQMKFLRLKSGDERNMPLTKHGIAQHSKEQKREDALEGGGLDLIIAPGVAFSKSGARLGHGGGYYDKFLEKVRSNPASAPKVMALAFTCQICDDIPMDEQDQKIDSVIYAE